MSNVSSSLPFLPIVSPGTEEHMLAMNSTPKISSSTPVPILPPPTRPVFDETMQDSGLESTKAADNASSTATPALASVADDQVWRSCSYDAVSLLAMKLHLPATSTPRVNPFGGMQPALRPSPPMETVTKITAPPTMAEPPKKRRSGSPLKLMASAGSGGGPVSPTPVQANKRARAHSDDTEDGKAAAAGSRVSEIRRLSPSPAVSHKSKVKGTVLGEIHNRRDAGTVTGKKRLSVRRAALMAATNIALPQSTVENRLSRQNAGNADDGKEVKHKFDKEWGTLTDRPRPFFTVNGLGQPTPNRGHEDAPVLPKLQGRTVGGEECRKKLFGSCSLDSLLSPALISSHRSAWSNFISTLRCRQRDREPPSLFIAFG